MFVVAFMITKKSKKPVDSYGASSIQVLEGLEAVRRRPGMYVGGADSRAMHNLLYDNDPRFPGLGIVYPNIVPDFRSRAAALSVIPII